MHISLPKCKQVFVALQNVILITDIILTIQIFVSKHVLSMLSFKNKLNFFLFILFLTAAALFFVDNSAFTYHFILYWALKFVLYYPSCWNFLFFKCWSLLGGTLLTMDQINFLNGCKLRMVNKDVNKTGKNSLQAKC